MKTLPNRIWTFWEPKTALPGYIQLCLKTWKIGIPNGEVVVLDYENLGAYLTKEEQDAVLLRTMSLPMQADCIRCAVLKKYGGIWLDADTIFTKMLDERFTQADVSIVARIRDGKIFNYGAFICALRPEAKFICDWHTQLVERMAKARRWRGSFFYWLFCHRAWRQMRRWNYCMNAMIDPLAAVADAKDYVYLPQETVNALPEERLMTSEGDAEFWQVYQDFWFRPGDPAEALKDNAGLIMLHNSWTPSEYRAMSAADFLKTPTRLAALLRQLLEV